MKTVATDRQIDIESQKQQVLQLLVSTRGELRFDYSYYRFTKRHRMGCRTVADIHESVDSRPSTQPIAQKWPLVQQQIYPHKRSQPNCSTLDLPFAQHRIQNQLKCISQLRVHWRLLRCENFGNTALHMSDLGYQEEVVDFVEAKESELRLDSYRGHWRQLY